MSVALKVVQLFCNEGNEFDNDNDNEFSIKGNGQSGRYSNKFLIKFDIKQINL